MGSLSPEYVQVRAHVGSLSSSVYVRVRMVYKRLCVCEYGEQMCMCVHCLRNTRARKYVFDTEDGGCGTHAGPSVGSPREDFSLHAKKREKKKEKKILKFLT